MQSINFISAVIEGLQFWVVLAAFVATFGIIKWRKNNWTAGTASILVLVGILAFLAIVPNGFYALLPPVAAEDLWGEAKKLPDYTALFTADLICVAVGCIAGVVCA
ncbi:MULTISPECIES: hypothetical protein [Pseudomonas putida group]|uniref:hypothetical protein n=1 Tax=Pseudomonas putida group TaxID=136845 RepID=UPI0005358660|nr:MULTISPECIES: hypothetical protein [Pseudomonas putida group]